jgi:hypothetical protein
VATSDADAARMWPHSPLAPTNAQINQFILGLFLDFNLNMVHFRADVAAFAISAFNYKIQSVIFGPFLNSNLNMVPVHFTADVAAFAISAFNYDYNSISNFRSVSGY